MAYWIYGKDYEVRCSNCHSKFIQMKTSKYCPCCKEKMDNAWGFMSDSLKKKDRKK